MADLFDRLIAREGGYNHDRDDPGGATKFGISQKSYPNLDIEKLTKEEARAIYFRDFYSKPRISDIPISLQEAVLDWYVHSGKIAIKTFQRLLGVEPDGRIGPNTLHACSLVDPTTFLPLYASERVRFLVRLVVKSPNKIKYLINWTNRALLFIVRTD